MKFRPCIDIHEGVVKQIVGSTLRDAPTKEDGAASSTAGSGLVTNFVATKSSAEFARTYREDGLPGGHVIMLGASAANTAAAKAALQAYPGGMQVGGGITPANAKEFLDAGASHIIVTSFVFRDGKIDWERLKELVEAVGGKEKLVLDLSCRKRPKVNGAGSSGGAAGEHEYVVVTDRWQKFTDFVVSAESLATLAAFCDEFLVHGVDVEGLKAGIEDGLVEMLGKHSPIPVTYAGGVRDLDDCERVAALGCGRVDVSIGSALDIFGGSLPYADVVKWAATKRS